MYRLMLLIFLNSNYGNNVLGKLIKQHYIMYNIIFFGLSFDFLLTVHDVNKLNLNNILKKQKHLYTK